MGSELRDRLPSPSAKSDASIWSVLKTCMGKDLSKIAMPVQFNEPLSFLQRVAEYMEYSEILKGFSESDPAQRLEVVGAFAVSGMASNWNRLGKPFNPLLHETFELERSGFRLICEQVSHHPPISAFHVESDEYVFQGWIYPKLKLWGKSVEIHPKGNMKLVLKRFSNETYTWANVNCTVHNIIVGKLWIEHHGTMEISCVDTGLKLALQFKPAGWFNNELHRFEGFVVDGKKYKQRYVYGKWTDCFKSTDVESYEEYIKTNAHKFKLGDPGNATAEKKSPSVSPSPPRKIFQKFNSLSIRSFSTSVDIQPAERSDDLSPENQEEVVPKDQSEVMEIPNSVKRWEVAPRPSFSPDYYHFTAFAMNLNQILPGQKLCPTDSRLRPDIRHMEEGCLDLAQTEKNRLEDQQRKTLKNHKNEGPPRYFEKVGDDWTFKSNYWNQPKDEIANLFE